MHIFTSFTLSSMQQILSVEVYTKAITVLGIFTDCKMFGQLTYLN